MAVIGITGGIGAGKSVVSRVLRCKGFTVYDCDSEARRLMEESDELKRDIACRLGGECLTPDGRLHRQAIASRIFGDDGHRRWLNSRVHAMVREDIAARAASHSDGTLFVESAIMRTSGLDLMCDAIWLVDAPTDLRLERACRRDGSDREAVLARMKSQASEFEDFACSSVATIENDGVTPLLPCIEELLEGL